MRQAKDDIICAAGVARAHNAVLDGEICYLETDGRTDSKPGVPAGMAALYAFDVLSIDGEDLTGQPVLERKRRPLTITPTVECRLLYLHRLEARGVDLYRVACERDL